MDGEGGDAWEGFTKFHMAPHAMSHMELGGFGVPLREWMFWGPLSIFPSPEFSTQKHMFLPSLPGVECSR